MTYLQGKVTKEGNLDEQYKILVDTYIFVYYQNWPNMQKINFSYYIFEAKDRIDLYQFILIYYFN